MPQDQPKPWERDYSVASPPAAAGASPAPKPWERDYNQTANPAPETPAPPAAPEPGFWNGLGTRVEDVLKGQGDSWIHGGMMADGGDPRQALSETFNPFHPIKTAGYLVPQPIKDVAARVGSGDVSGAAGDLAGSVLPNLPALLSGTGFGARIGRAVADKAPDLYKSSLKPPTTMSVADSNKLIQTGLQNEIPISKGGLGRINGLIEGLNDQVNEAINARPDVAISPRAVGSRVDALLPRFSEQVNPVDDLTALHGAKNEFLSQHTVRAPFTKIAFRPVDGGPVGAVPVGEGVATYPQDIPGPKAQRLKVGTYRQLGNKAYGELKTASVEGQKALASGLREELNGAYPEIEPLNAREGALINLRDPLQRAVQRTSNYEPIGLQTPLIGAAVKGITGSNPVSLAGGAASAMLRNPFIRSHLAIEMYRAGLPVGAVPRVWGLASPVAGANTSPRRNQPSESEP